MENRCASGFSAIFKESFAIYPGKKKLIDFLNHCILEHRALPDPNRKLETVLTSHTLDDTKLLTPAIDMSKNFFMSALRPLVSKVDITCHSSLKVA